MLAREIYKQIHSKAEEVKDAIHAVYVARTERRKEPTWRAEDLIEYFSIYNEISSEADIRKDERRHVKVLCADYCGLRDELLRLLTADWAPTAKENHED
jgi:hypothetical protein